METRANYILIGLFTIFGFLGMLLFTLWFTHLELNRQFAYYDVRFESVSGLARASDVRFAGLPVGQVVEVRLAPENDGSILVRLEVNADTPVRTTSTATIESQGVTGVSYVGISPGEAKDPLLRDESDKDVPEIKAGRSLLQTFTEDAPKILDQVLKVSKDLGKILNDENVSRIDHIIANTERASGSFAQSLDDFSVVAGAISGFAIEISNFNVMLKGVTSKAETVFDSADRTLNSITSLAEESKETMAAGTRALDQANITFKDADTYINGHLSDATNEAIKALQDARTEIAGVAEGARKTLAEFEKTGAAANARLEQLKTTISAADTAIAQLDDTLVAMEKASDDFDELVINDGAALIKEARDALAPIAKAAQEDLPAMMQDIRAATASARASIENVGRSLTSASDKVDLVMSDAHTTLTTVTDTFVRANTTLDDINDAMAIADRTLSAAERAFDGADRIINEDVSGMIADLRHTLTELDKAIAGVTDAIPSVTSDIEAASNAARETFETISGTVRAADPSVREFAATALPQFTQLAREARRLVENINRIAKQIERNPARFFLGAETPVYKR